MPESKPTPLAIRAIIQLALTAGVTALVVAVGFGLLEMSQNGRFPLEFASFLAPMIFAAVLVGIPVIGWPTMNLAQRIGWDHSYVLIALIGGIIGGLAIMAFQIIAYGPVEGTSPWGIFFAIIGAVAGLIAAPVWKLLSKTKSEKVTS